MAGTFDFPLGADEDVLGLSYVLGQKSVEKKEKDLAEYFSEFSAG